MKSTVFIDFLLFLLLSTGCALWTPPRCTLAEAQRAARERLIEVRRAELLDRAAKIQVEHTQTVPLLRKAQNYRGNFRDAAGDPALKTLDAAIIYARIATATDPAAESARWAEKLIGFDTAVLCCKWVCSHDEDVKTSLLFVTGWDEAKLRRFDRSSLKTPEFRLFPAHPESEQFLQQEKEKAPFLLASELYRNPSPGSITRAMNFRKTLLNTHLLHCGMLKADDPHRILELRLVDLRAELFQ